MSIFVTSLFPLILAGAPAPIAAVPVAPVAVKVSPAKPVLAPAVVKAQQAAPNAPVGGEIILTQQGPSPSPKPAPAPTTPTVDKNAVIDRVAQSLTAVKTAQGKFTQTAPGNATSSGAFYISRPGKIRFEYTSPEPMFIVSDGTSVSIEEPKRKSYDAVPLSSTPFALFLRSNVDLKKDGSVKKVESLNGSHFITLEDRSGEAEGQMILEFRASDFALLGWRAVDGSGQPTTVRLTDVQQNVKLKPNLFIVKDTADSRDNRR